MTHTEDINKIIEYSLSEVLPDRAVIKALTSKTFSDGDIFIVAVGKAAYRMAEAASKVVSYKRGIVITKYGHAGDDLDDFEIFEAGHPLLDAGGIRATKRVLELTEDLKENDTVIFLVSGGGSALFEDPLIRLEELQDVNRQLLECGANIKEINTIRKHLSNVKGGRFALHCRPARIFQIVISDVIGNDLDVIASGPAVCDTSTVEDVDRVIEKYQLDISEETMDILHRETPKDIANVETVITTSVNDLCLSAEKKAAELGYITEILSLDECGYAKDTGHKLAQKALEIYEKDKRPHCLIMGGETVVKVKGKGLGGRNQELALSTVPYIKDKDITIVSLGSDGTDGPTDAAGGIVNGSSYKKLKDLGIDITEVLEDSDSYNALKQIDGLIFTGPTGTNVNDLMMALINKNG
ncbi:MAG: glycerate kinase [Erysipelotrichaceae bacterium]|nr:glycerate kinase [Erysipelotrichaceae bacterium]